jgi:hypothetical protein
MISHHGYKTHQRIWGSIPGSKFSTVEKNRREDMELQFAAQSRRMSELSQLKTESLRAQEQRILEKVRSV